MQKFALYVPLVAGLIAAPLMAQTSDPPAQVTPAAIDAGRTVFHGAGTCFACHGANLEGAIGPQLTAHEWKDAKGGTFDAIVGVVAKGVDGTAMVSHPGGISDAQVQQVAAYIWAVSHGKAKP
jgi:cytochrome c oxidase cbb3-type subunit 3